MDFQELRNWSEYTKIFLGVFALVPPPIIVPLFLGIMAGRSTSEKKKAALVGAVGFFVAMTLFAFLGDGLLAIFGITLPAFRLAGGFLLLLIALDMMRAAPTQEQDIEDRRGASVMALGIVPLTIPILAGPGAMSAVVLFAADHEGLSHRMLVALVLLTVAIYVFVILRIAASAEKLFTPSVALIFNKIMGLVICAIAFEFIMDGIAGHFPLLVTLHNN